MCVWVASRERQTGSEQASERLKVNDSVQLDSLQQTHARARHFRAQASATMMMNCLWLLIAAAAAALPPLCAGSIDRIENKALH